MTARNLPLSFKRLRSVAAWVACVGVMTAVLHAPTAQAEPRRPECIAPAAPGGGFDLTCRLTQAALKEAGALQANLRTVYMPGGGGAVAYNTIAAQRPAEDDSIVAFSSGTLLSVAQGKYGRYTVDDVRWVASVGADYGVAVVHADSPFNSLADLMNALKADPGKVVFGSSGTVGNQDWMKAALTAKQAGIDPGKMRVVPFEGGGEIVTALRGKHIDAYMGDAAEAATLLQGGTPVKILAVFHSERLPGLLSEVPTAAEQGFDIEWPIIRGFYVGPKVSDEAYAWWVEAFKQTMTTETFTQLQAQQGLFPMNLTGAELDAFVQRQAEEYKVLARSFGLIKE